MSPSLAAGFYQRFNLNPDVHGTAAVAKRIKYRVIMGSKSGLSRICNNVMRCFDLFLRSASCLDDTSRT